MHHLEPNTDYAIYKIEVAVKLEDVESGKAYDEIHALLDNEPIADWAYKHTHGLIDAPRLYSTGDTVTEGEPFCKTFPMTLEETKLGDIVSMSICDPQTQVSGYRVFKGEDFGFVTLVPYKKDEGVWVSDDSKFFDIRTESPSSGCTLLCPLGL